MKPKQLVPVLMILEDGSVEEGHWLKDINKYERNVNRWRIYRTRKTVPDNEVIAWVDMKDISEWIKCQCSIAHELGRVKKDRLIHYNFDV